MGQTLLKFFKMQSQSESLKTKLCEIFAALICTQSQEIPKIKNEFKIALLDQINSLEIRQLQGFKLTKDKLRTPKLSSLVTLVNFEGSEAKLDLMESLVILFKQQLYNDLSRE